MMPARTPRTEVTVEAVAKIVERLRHRTVAEEDYETLQGIVGSYLQVFELLQTRGVSIRDLRRLLGARPSEKLKDLEGSESEQPPSGSNGDSSEEGTNGPSDQAGDEAGRPTDADDTGSTDEGDENERKGHGRLGVDAYAGAEQVRVPHEGLCPGDPCPLCPKGKVYPLQPRRIVRVVGQEPFKAWLYELERLRCNLCGEVFTAKAPPDVGEEKYDAGAAALLAVMRYGMGLPMYRLEKLQASMAVPLPDATQWDILHEASSTVAVAFDELIRQAAQADTVVNDDTFVRILSLMKENESLDPDKDRTGVFTTGIIAASDQWRIALYFSGRQHAGENLRDVLEERANARPPPIQMCDGLDRNLPGELETIVGNCIAHGRRKFVEQHASFPEESLHVLEELAKVYRNDAIARERSLDDAERLAFHQKESAPIMAELQAWMKAKIENREVEQNSGLGRAITYMRKRWDRLTLFLRKEGAPLDANVVERSLKKAILHRKNSLFYKTEAGARVGDIFMSLINTCLLNDTDPRLYLIALLENGQAVKESPADWMPWNYQSVVPSD